MHRRLKLIVSAVSLFALTAFLIGCGAPAANNTATNTVNSSTTSKPTPAATTPANTVSNDAAKTDADDKTETAAADKIGVPECDDYIAKVNACLSSKVPESARAAFKTSMDSTVKGWKAAAATPQGKAALATGCKTATESMKASLSTYNCTW
jgi:hypothetical protein